MAESLKDIPLDEAVKMLRQPLTSDQRFKPPFTL
jgi:hypothetical protein